MRVTVLSDNLPENYGSKFGLLAYATFHAGWLFFMFVFVHLYSIQIWLFLCAQALKAVAPPASKKGGKKVNLKARTQQAKRAQTKNHGRQK